MKSVFKLSKDVFSVLVFLEDAPAENLISKKNQKARLQFARAHMNWIVADLEKVLWSDESKCNLLTSHCIRYTR